MTRRLETVLSGMARKNRKLFCAYITLGYPNLKTTRAAIRALEQAGTDILELGFPFSDPLADGPTIQSASEAALKHQVRLEDAFRLIGGLRKEGFKMPVFLFSYLNPVLQLGPRKTALKLFKYGFDGAIIPDLNPEEARDWERQFKAKGLSLVFLAAPTTENERMVKIANHSSGFVYYVSLKGVTGARSALPGDLKFNVNRLRRATRKPVLVGFGVSNEKQARTISKFSDGVIVGSALVRLLKNRRHGIQKLKNFAGRLVHAMNSHTK